MKEREIMKRALEGSIPNKESLRRECLSHKKGVGLVKRITIAVACILLLCTSVALIPLVKKENNKKEYNVNKDVIARSENSESISADSESVCEESESISEDIAPESNEEYYDPNAIGGGESGLCPVHNIEYHGVPGNLIDYVGEEAFREWDSQFLDEEGWYIRDENGCYAGWNIVAFINYFNIPDEVIIEGYPGYYSKRSAYWNLDLLLTRDEAAYEVFARKTSLTKEEERIYEDRERDESFKHRVLDLLKEKTDERSVAYYNKITYNGTKYVFEEFSILDMVENSSLTKEDIESVCSVDERIGTQLADFVYRYTYNTDLLFEDKVALYAEIEKLEDIPYVPRAAQIDELLHIGYNGELTIRGEAVETEYGIYIPEGMLPMSDEDLPLEKDIILYKGRIYWYTDTVTESEAHISEHIHGTTAIGHTHADLEKGRTIWESFRYYHFASSSKGDVYLMKDYDPAFRIMLNVYDQDPNTMKIYESNRGITLKKGSDLYGEKGLALSDNALSVCCGERELSRGLSGELFTLLEEGAFVLDRTDMSVYRSVELTVTMDDLSRVTLKLYENGYIEYSEISGYSVYLEAENTELIGNLMKY